MLLYNYINLFNHLSFVAIAELKPEIVDEIIPEVTKQGGQAMLNCTVVNKGSNTVCTQQSKNYSEVLLTEGGPHSQLRKS